MSKHGDLLHSVRDLREMIAEEGVGFQVAPHANGRYCVWLNVDGVCVLRVTGVKVVEITDFRNPKVDDEMTENATAEDKAFLRDGMNGTSNA